MSPKDETCAVNIPAFLSKLWKIVNDPEIDKIIGWSADGRSFVIKDQAQFWYNILPVYYKHNNMSSFVRQLNMYGFHKIHSDGKEREHDELKFYHPFFRKNQPSLMKNIKRKMTVSHRTPVKTELAETTPAEGQAQTQVTNLNHMTKVLVDVKQLQTRQESVDNQLASMKKENAALWRELALLRQKHMKQQQLVNKLIHFLVHIVNPSRGNMGGMGRKRKFPLMINDIASGSSKSQKTVDSSSSDDGIVIHEVESEYILPNEKDEHEHDREADEFEEEALIDSPDNIMMDSTDEFLDIPMTDEVVDSPDSLCPDNILAEDPNIEVIEPEVTEVLDVPLQAVEEEEDVSFLTPSTIDISDLIVSPTASTSLTTPTRSTVEAMFPNLSSAKQQEQGEDIDDAEDTSKKKKKKKKKTMPSKPGNSNSNPNPNSKCKEQDIDLIDLDKDKTTKNANLTIATCNTIPETSTAITLNSPDDFENHLEATQEELDTIKELLLDGYTLDPNTVLNLNSSIFTDMPLQLFMSDDNLNLPFQPQTQTQSQNAPSTSTSTAGSGSGSAGASTSTSAFTSEGNKDNEEMDDFSCDPMMSGSGHQIMPYNVANMSASTSNLLDFENLFENETSPDSTMDPAMELMDLVNMAESENQSTLNTPVQIKMEPPSFPSSSFLSPSSSQLLYNKSSNSKNSYSKNSNNNNSSNSSSSNNSNQNK